MIIDVSLDSNFKVDTSIHDIDLLRNNDEVYSTTNLPVQQSEFSSEFL